MERRITEPPSGGTARRARDERNKCERGCATVTHPLFPFGPPPRPSALDPVRKGSPALKGAPWDGLGIVGVGP